MTSRFWCLFLACGFALTLQRSGLGQDTPQIQPTITIPIQGGEERGTAVAVGDGVVVLTSFTRFSQTTVSVHETATGKQIFTLDPIIGEDDRLYNFGLDIAIDGGVAAVGAPKSHFEGSTRGGGVFLFDLESGEQVKLLHSTSIPPPGMRGVSLGATVDIEEGFVATGDRTGEAYVFDQTTGAEVWRFAGPVYTPMSTYVSLHEQWLAVARSEDNEIVLHDILSNSPPRVIRGPEGVTHTSVVLSDYGLLAIEVERHSENLLNLYETSGNLLESIRVPSFADMRVDRLNERLLVSHRHGLEVRDLRTLDVIAEPVVPSSARYIAMHGNVVAVSTSEAFYIYHIPEPCCLLNWFSVGMLLLMRRKHDRTRVAIPSQV